MTGFRQTDELDIRCRTTYETVALCAVVGGTSILVSGCENTIGTWSDFNFLIANHSKSKTT